MSARAHRLIAQGDRHRSDGDWAQAAERYHQAIALDPRLVHIHVQLGHAFKETGRLPEAEQAYRQAIARAPHDADALLHLGHLLKGQQRFGAAGEAYAAALALKPVDAELLTEIGTITGQLSGPERDRLLGRVSFARPGDLLGEEASSRQANGPALYFDISDIVLFLRQPRRPSGIQRVQLEVVAGALEWAGATGTAVVICCATDAREGWVELPPTLFKQLADLVASDRPDAGQALEALKARIAALILFAPPIDFAPRARLISLGATWWLQNYFLHLRDARSRADILYVPFVHDLIPVIHPEFHTAELTVDFIDWLVPALAHADAMLVNSLSTRNDLLRAAAGIGRSLSPEMIATVPLDATFPQPPRRDAPPPLPAGIEDQPFVLFVSTIEPRKGHLVALEAWSQLIRRSGADAVPLLVCVGGNGWKNDGFHATLRDDLALAGRVLVLSNIADATLDELYRHSLFTLYPSFYEGWGLPVTEALGHGKVVVTTSSSSLPEAGGDLALYVPPGDAGALADMVDRLVTDPAWRASLEERIARRGSPRSWAAVARQICEHVLALPDPSRAAVQAPSAAPGRFHAVGRLCADRLAPDLEAGEQFRSGLGWRWPERWGCRVKAGGGVLRFRLADGGVEPGARLVLGLRLRGVDGGPCSWAVTLGGEVAGSGSIAASGREWVRCPVVAPQDGMIEIHVAGGEVRAAAGDAGTIGDTVGVEGFMLRLADDDGDWPLLPEAPSI